MTNRSAVPATAADSWQGYRYLADNAIDVVLEANLETVIQWISPSVEEVLGFRPDQLVGLSAPDIIHPDDIHEIMALARSINERAARVRAARVRIATRAGGWKALQLRGRAALDENDQVVGHIITMQDTSDRDSALQALQMLSEGNRALATSEDSAELIAAICRVIVDTGGHWFAWYGIAEDDVDRSVRPVAHAGTTVVDLADLHLTWADVARGQTSISRALRSRTTQVRSDYPAVETHEAWESAIREGGFRSSISIPVMVRGRLHGALSVYSEEPGTFDGDVRDLLETLASDLGLGLTRYADDARVRASEARYRLLAENSSDVVWQALPHGTILWASDSVRHVLGWLPEEVVGRDFDLVHPDDRETTQSVLRALTQGQPAEGEARIEAADGSWRWMAFAAHRAHGPDGVVDVVALRDIDAEVRAREALVHAIGHDPLTGMAARATMVQRVADALDRLPDRQVCAALCVGVDRLSAINDAFTHSAGDLVLTTLAARLAGALDSPDLIGRGAGVEFLVMAPDLTSGDEVIALADDLLRSARGPITVGEHTVDPTVSIGIAIGNRQTDPEQLVRDASLAMGQAKAEGRDRYAFADTSLADLARRRIDIESRIRAGLASDRFIPFFQPVVDLATGSLTGYEALVRYRRDDGTIAPPADFMPIAELSPIVCDIDMAMLRGSLAQLRALPVEQTIAVNLSTVTLTRPGYARVVERLIRESGVEPSRLHLEVTETALLGEIGLVVEIMDAVASLGARWYVDDFGTGYSSISHLRDLPVSGLKLDVSFSGGIRAGDDKSVRLAQALVGLAQGLGLDTVAEGIEGAGEADVLLAQGWQHGQGWLYGRPAPLP